MSFLSFAPVLIVIVCGSLVAAIRESTKIAPVLEQVQVLARHCDRTQITPRVFPACPVNLAEDLGLGPATLTPLGENQCFRLGEWLRERYFGASSRSCLLPDCDGMYRPDMFKFIASQTSRSIRSINAVAMGLLPDRRKPDIVSTEEDFVYLGTVIVELARDRLMKEGTCPGAMKVRPDIFLDPAVQEWLGSTQQRMKAVTDAVGFPESPISSVIEIFENAVALLNHDKLCDPIAQLLPEMESLWAELLEMLYVRPTPRVRPCGSALAERIMREFDSQEGTKYIQYSGHDVTLARLYYALHLQDDYPLLLRPADYGETLIFEKWTRSDGSSFLKIFLRKGYVGMDAPSEAMELKLRSFGCGDETEDCDFDVFKQLVLENVVSTDEEWCQWCENDFSEECVRVLLDSCQERESKRQSTDELEPEFDEF